MALDKCALAFLAALERAEVGVLNWGLTDSFFSDAELQQKAIDFIASFQESGATTSYSSGWDLVEALLDERLLWRIPETERYRTRMAETVRLFARLRQIFPDARGDAWRTAPNLVADYRLVVRPRVSPARDVSSNVLIRSLRERMQPTSLQQDVIRALVRADTEEERKVAQFQAKATERILRLAGEERSTGTVVSAGTGSGKTLAFYLPAYAAMAGRLSGEYWTKCLAIYPRNELLKDQLREALANARRIAPTLAAHGRRKFVIAGLYGKVPYSASDVAAAVDGWRRFTLSGQTAYECPFVRCPECGENMAWRESDVAREVENLECTNRQCNARVESDEIRLTRRRMLAEPPDILFTSTEMLNQRLSARRFAGLLGIGRRPDRRPEFVLLDEIHAYEGTHGAHVAFLLRRWRKASEARPHFVGLSATLADAPRFFAELIGVGPGDVAEVRPESGDLRGDGAEYMLAVRGDPSSGTSLLSTTIQSLMLLRRVLAAGSNDYFGTRVFAFTDNLDVINRLYHSLLDAEGWDSFGRPNPTRAVGSLANLRSTTLANGRERLEVGQNWALAEDIGHVLAPGNRVRVARTSSQDAGVDANAGIVVATASLEVGFDDPEVGAVLQHKAPHNPAAFLQRKGRAGRRQTMRPWTVVVLSDYGRDRAAYQGYDQLFSPFLPARHLPLRNRAILRMQATYTLFDWLARRLPLNHSPDPWTDFSQPASDNPHTAAEVTARQNAYAQSLRGLLEQSALREEFSVFLSRSLSINEEEVGALFWEPPRALLTETVPTLLRRLERGWTLAGRPGLENHVWWAPLPEFVPRTLFSDLQLPEVSIRIPQQGRTPARVEAMPVAQALREFAPGRVSRRFGVAHGGERHWIAPGDGTDVSIESFCPAVDRQELGRFRYLGEDGHLTDIPVFRPHAVNVSVAPLTIQQSSNSFLHWYTEIVPTGEHHELDLPARSRWREVLRSISVHSHHLGSPIELRRFAAGATASIGHGKGQQTVHSLRFVCASPEVTTDPAAMGFVADVDGIEIRFVYPKEFHKLCQNDARLLIGLRPARFRYLIRRSPTLNGVANDFQRDWIAQVYLSTVTVTALREQVTLKEAESAVFHGASVATIREVLETILQWAEAETDANATHGDDDLPKRLRELSELLDRSEAKHALHEAAAALWEDIDGNWESWLRARFKATLGAALLDAAHSLCPRMDPAALVVDLAALVSPGQTVGDTENVGTVWLTESTIGGGGFIEEFVARYAEDPRRFVRLLDTALAPSDLEVTSDEIGRVLRLVASGNPRQNGLTAAFLAVREATSHAESVKALTMLRTALSRNGIQPTPTLIVSLNLRILRPGTSGDVDTFVATALTEWEEAEQRLGIDIDSRVIALVKSGDSSFDQAIRLNSTADPDSVSPSWRYGVLSGLFWSRGAQVRTESLRAWNPFERFPDCDRLLVLAALSSKVHRVPLSNPSWFADLTAGLVRDGTVHLVCGVAESKVMADALLRVGTDAIDSDALLIHGRLLGLNREGDDMVAEIDLPEALQ